ncbi:8552_t:CDS:2, partial [Paraglomus occultum]
MNALYDSTCDFLRVALPEHITAFSVVYHAMNELQKESLRQIFHQAITAVMPSYKAGSEKYQKLQGLPLKFDDAFEGMCSLRDFEVTREEEELSTETIENNLRLLKGTLKKARLGRIKSSELLWRNPFASQVLSSEMMEVKQLSEEDYESFMEPAKNMEASLPHSIERACDIFLTNYNDGSTEIPPQKLSYKNWRESEEVLRDIAVRILDTLGGIWKHPAFSPKFAKTQSEGTYVADIIVPIIRATLKDLPIGKSAYVSTAERQSVASKDRRGEKGKRPDIMFIAKHMDRIYELMFAECSRIICSGTKEDEDRVKLWRELNDGLYWTNRGCKLEEKNEFGILGFQIAGQNFKLYVLIRDHENISRLFLLRSVKIPIQYTNDRRFIFEFIEALLLMRRILIVDLSLLFNSGTNESGESSSTVSTP